MAIGDYSDTIMRGKASNAQAAMMMGKGLRGGFDTLQTNYYNNQLAPMMGDPNKLNEAQALAGKMESKGLTPIMSGAAFEARRTLDQVNQFKTAEAEKERAAKAALAEQQRMQQNADLARKNFEGQKSDLDGLIKFRAAEGFTGLPKTLQASVNSQIANLETALANNAYDVSGIYKPTDTSASSAPMATNETVEGQVAEPVIDYTDPETLQQMLNDKGYASTQSELNKYYSNSNEGTNSTGYKNSTAMLDALESSRKAALQLKTAKEQRDYERAEKEKAKIAGYEEKYQALYNAQDDLNRDTSVPTIARALNLALRKETGAAIAANEFADMMKGVLSPTDRAAFVASMPRLEQTLKVIPVVGVGFNPMAEQAMMEHAETFLGRVNTKQLQKYITDKIPTEYKDYRSKNKKVEKTPFEAF